MSSFPTISFNFTGLYFSTLFLRKHIKMLTWLFLHYPKESDPESFARWHTFNKNIPKWLQVLNWRRCPRAIWKVHENYTPKASNLPQHRNTCFCWRRARAGHLDQCDTVWQFSLPITTEIQYMWHWHHLICQTWVQPKLLFIPYLSVSADLCQVHSRAG